MWTSRNRARYDRSKLRYPSGATWEKWARRDALMAAWNRII
jgi:hypothetical protein